MTNRSPLNHLAPLLFIFALTSCSASEPSEINVGDAQVIESLKEAGSDLSKPHLIEFFFEGFADQSSADRFGAQFERANWKLDVHQTPESSNWTVIAKTLMVPEIHAISDLSAKFDRLALEYGGDYDGWETRVIK